MLTRVHWLIGPIYRWIHHIIPPSYMYGVFSRPPRWCVLLGFFFFIYSHLFGDILHLLRPHSRIQIPLSPQNVNGYQESTPSRNVERSVERVNGFSVPNHTVNPLARAWGGLIFELKLSLIAGRQSYCYDTITTDGSVNGLSINIAKLLYCELKKKH